MKKIHKLLLLSISLLLSSSILQAKEEEMHKHSGTSNVKINYEVLDFIHSKKKKDGKRYGIEIDHENENNHFQLYIEKTDTRTTKLVPKDLDVKKIAMKYQYKFSKGERLSFSYATIDDNIMKETNGGNIYGLGYSNSVFAMTQYLSDYPHFNVYQTDLKYTLKHEGIKWTALGKYIHLSNKNSNNFSKKANNDYLTVGLKVHTHYKGYHLGAAVFTGNRMFAVMKEGFQVQHHAMEFKQTYMCGVGHKLGENMSMHLRYVHHNAKEVPIGNAGVKVDVVSFDMLYTF